MDNRQNSTNINWYPGHMAKTKREIREKLNLIDVVYEVVDARMPISSKIKDIDEIIKNKKKIMIMSKYDLCDSKETDKFIKYYENSGYIVISSSIGKEGINKILFKTNELMEEEFLKMEKKGLKRRAIRVLVVGVPNVGKSTLINTLTDAGVLAEDKLFATLDTTTRKVKLPNGTEILLTDTVGFIQKLPHHLIQAFRATLEELNFADILIHVVDASNENRQEQMNIVYQTLKGLHCETTPVITVYNKIDKNVQTPLPIDNIARDRIAISAKTKKGLDVMLEKIETLLKSFRTAMKVFLPYTEGSLLNMVHGKCEIITEQHKAEGIFLEIYASKEMENRLQKYKIEE